MLCIIFQLTFYSTFIFSAFGSAFKTLLFGHFFSLLPLNSCLPFVDGSSIPQKNSTWPLYSLHLSLFHTHDFKKSAVPSPVSVCPLRSCWSVFLTNCWLFLLGFHWYSSSACLEENPSFLHSAHTCCSWSVFINDATWFAVSGKGSESLSTTFLYSFSSHELSHL